MFGFGKGKKVAAVVTVPDFVEVRSFYDNAFHVVATADEFVLSPKQNPALCGYDNWLPTASPQAVTVESMKDSLPLQRGNWFWCSGCKDAFLP